MACHWKQSLCNDTSQQPTPFNNETASSSSPEVGHCTEFRCPRSIPRSSWLRLRSSSWEHLPKQRVMQAEETGSEISICRVLLGQGFHPVACMCTKRLSNILPQDDAKSDAWKRSQSELTAIGASTAILERPGRCPNGYRGVWVQVLNSSGCGDCGVYLPQSENPAVSPGFQAQPQKLA